MHLCIASSCIFHCLSLKSSILGLKLGEERYFKKAMPVSGIPMNPVFTHSLKFVLAQVHRDPLFKIKGLRKLECFSEKRFEELKILIKEYISFSRVKKDSLSGKTSGIQHEHRSRGKKEYISRSYSSFFAVSNRERVWWDKENWKDIEDIENPWGELSESEEYFLKKILKGKV